MSITKPIPGIHDDVAYSRNIPLYGFGRVAKEYGNLRLPNQVCKSAAGYYIGTQNEEGPFSRESEEYYDSHGEAMFALVNKEFTQRGYP